MEVRDGSDLSRSNQTHASLQHMKGEGVRLVALLGTLLLAGCSPQRDEAPHRRELPRAALQDGRDAFDIMLPKDCNLTSNDTQMDFQVFRVVCGEIAYAAVYVGNAADQSIPRSRLLPTPFDWPSQVQAWSFSVPSDQDRADQIAASVRVRGPT